MKSKLIAVAALGGLMIVDAAAAPLHDGSPHVEETDLDHGAREVPDIAVVSGVQTKDLLLPSSVAIRPDPDSLTPETAVDWLAVVKADAEEHRPVVSPIIV